MIRQRTFFLIDDLLFEVEKPEITLRKIRVAQVKFENEEYKKLRRKYNEDIFHLEKFPDGWHIEKRE
ncbi:hypothetical protein [Neobacillus ginsengisoli]|uniref:Uncharacterized protein n=1 Tax=Neobacillus ginsengisoli TaxID=904295 RepID=A0ABT9XX17_9BACI|nr:hypothetical protein [Neobacillus ginsengisoli]MDQ0200049.1 hypothetical protein [Neobacillus ginsengisoli]